MRTWTTISQTRNEQVNQIIREEQGKGRLLTAKTHATEPDELTRRQARKILQRRNGER